MCKEDMPLVTVYVTCYNQERYIVETLESVRAQTYPNMELIVCDDCSTDGSREIIRRWLTDRWPEARFIQHERNTGICRSLNEIIRASRGTYLAGIAGDDLWRPEKTAWQVEIMESMPNRVGVLYSDAHLIDETGAKLPGRAIEYALNASDPKALELFEKKLLKTKMPGSGYGRILPAGDSEHPFSDGSGMDLFEQRVPDLFNFMIHWSFIPAQSVMVRRRCYQQVGKYDETLFYEDWDMWLRIARRYSFVIMGKALASYRIHSGSTMHVYRKEVFSSIPAMFRKYARKGWLKGTGREEYGAACLEQHALLQYRRGLRRRHMAIAQWCQHDPNRENLFMLLCSLVGLNYLQYQAVRDQIGKKHRMRK